MPTDILRIGDPIQLLDAAREALQQAKLHGNEVTEPEVRRLAWQCNLFVLQMRKLLGPEAEAIFRTDNVPEWEHRDFQVAGRPLGHLMWEHAVTKLAGIVWYLEGCVQTDTAWHVSPHAEDHSRLFDGTRGTHHDFASSPNSSGA